MSQLPQISVIIPLYNRKHYIQQAVDSVLNQTFDDYEILILDNQSTDGGYELCENLYGNNLKVRLIRQNHQSGLGDSRNLGISLSRGKYIAFLDSDDLYVNNGLETVYSIAESTNAEVIHSPGWIVSEDDGGQTINSTSVFKPQIADRIPIDKNDLYFDSNVKNRINMLLNGMLCLNVWSKIYLRDYLIENDITFPDTLNEDVTFTILNLIYAKRYVRIPHIWNIYRISPDSLTFRRKNAEFLPKILNSMLVGLKHMNTSFQKCKFFQDNPEYADILKEHFLTDLLRFHLFEGNVYISDSLDRLKLTSKKVLNDYFDEDHLEFVNVLFNNMGIYQARMKQLMYENQTLKTMINTK